MKENVVRNSLNTSLLNKSLKSIKKGMKNRGWLARKKDDQSEE